MFGILASKSTNQVGKDHFVYQILCKSTSQAKPSIGLLELHKTKGEWVLALKNTSTSGKQTDSDSFSLARVYQFVVSSQKSSTSQDQP